MGAVQSRIYVRWGPRVYVVESLRNRTAILSFQKFRDGFGVQFASRNVEAVGSGFGHVKKVVGHRDGGLHADSVTRVIPQCGHTKEATNDRNAAG